MNDLETLHSSINLYVQGKISQEDATRQMNTAETLLKRFQNQAGVILADEVGMGKTFVALAAAVSVALKDPENRPVVIMVPSSVKDKWPLDFKLFREYCVCDKTAEKLDYGVASRAVEFLKLIDDPPARRKSIIFLTHGAMSRSLADPFVKFALLRQALENQGEANDKLRQGLARFAGDLLQKRSRIDKRDSSVWGELLDSPLKQWREILERKGIDRPYDTVQYTNNNPLPEPLVKILPSLDTTSLYSALRAIPIKKSKHYNKRIKMAREAINGPLRQAWREAVKQMHLHLPLIVLDEAHHAKNAGTQLASLFAAPEAEDDAREVTGGVFGGVFERMLFMTATPFQLGHHELCNVLQRFEGLAWDSPKAPPGGQSGMKADITNLRDKLDRSQEAAMRLEQAWGQLKPEDLQVDRVIYQDAEQWWQAATEDRQLTDRGRQALNRAYQARNKLRDAERLLSQWVIRNTRPQKLPAPYQYIPRRRRVVGNGILGNTSSDHEPRASLPGIPVQGDPALPFLLAARLVTCTPESRPVFAEGLASSYEAFLDTRRRREADHNIVDKEETLSDIPDPGDAGRWYLEQIDKIVGRSGNDGPRLAHPKLDATVDRAINLWKQGEKVLIFIHYIATGRALREALSARIRSEIEKWYAFDKLNYLASRLKEGEPAARACRQQVDNILSKFPQLSDESERIHRVILRFLRRPSFIVRYFDFKDGTITKAEVDRAFDTADASGLSLRKVVQNFLYFLAQQCSEADRKAYLDAVEKIQTGATYGGDTIEEQEDGGRRQFVGNVRLINGSTAYDTRHRLMLAFNTPFFPEIMITSSVMAEGVDLQLNCRHIIHHDLAWNPSNLEQRTGRIDRIGAKAENAGQPIHVYMPYVAETQDEKMYRVVMDRERWFNIVMGGRIVTNASATEEIANQIPLPESAKNALMLDLSV